MVPETCSPVRDGVDYGGGARNEKWQNLDRFDVYCGVYHIGPYIVRHGKTLTDTTWRSSPRRTFESVTAAHDPGATRIGLAVDASVKDSVFLCYKNKTRLEAHSRNTTASRRVETSERRRRWRRSAHRLSYYHSLTK